MYWRARLRVDSALLRSPAHSRARRRFRRCPAPRRSGSHPATMPDCEETGRRRPSQQHLPIGAVHRHGAEHQGLFGRVGLNERQPPAIRRPHRIGAIDQHGRRLSPGRGNDADFGNAAARPSSRKGNLLSIGREARVRDARPVVRELQAASAGNARDEQLEPVRIGLADVNDHLAVRRECRSKARCSDDSRRMRRPLPVRTAQAGPSCRRQARSRARQSPARRPRPSAIDDRRGRRQAPPAGCRCSSRRPPGPRALPRPAGICAAAPSRGTGGRSRAAPRGHARGVARLVRGGLRPSTRMSWRRERANCRS